MRRRLFLPLLVVASGALAACVPVTQPPPPPPPQPVSQYCAPTTPSSPTAYKAAFDNLRKTYTEWATADGAVPVHLPGGRTLWMFGDTYIGSVGADGTLQPGARLVSNSAVLQAGRCFKPILGGAPLARSAWIAPPGADHAYWPASAIVDEANDRLNIVLMHVVLQPGSTAVSGVGTRIARFRASTLKPLGVTGIIPGTSELRPYGSTAFQEDGTAYLYSSNGGNFHVARAPVATLTNQATWQYWTGPGDVWSAPGAANAAVALEFSTSAELVGPLGIGAPYAPLRVARHGDGFLGTAMKVDGISREVFSYTAPTPFGPWTESATATAITPTTVRSYGAQTLFGLQGGAAPMLSYSTNLLPGQTITTINSYGFRFVAVTLPPAPTTAEVPGSTLPPSTEPPTSSTSSSTSTSTSTTTSSTSTTTTAPP